MRTKRNKQKVPEPRKELTVELAKGKLWPIL